MLYRFLKMTRVTHELCTNNIRQKSIHQSYWNDNKFSINANKTIGLNDPAYTLRVVINCFWQKICCKLESRNRSLLTLVLLFVQNVPKYRFKTGWTSHEIPGKCRTNLNKRQMIYHWNEILWEMNAGSHSQLTAMLNKWKLEKLLNTSDNRDMARFVIGENTSTSKSNNCLGQVSWGFYNN